MAGYIDYKDDYNNNNRRNKYNPDKYHHPEKELSEYEVNRNEFK